MNAVNKYKEGTYFRCLDKKVSGYWEINCPQCSKDKYVIAGVCDGKFKILKGDIDKGVVPCRCSHAFRWTQEQREFQIKDAIKPLKGIFKGWVSGGYKGRSSKFLWVCCRGHEDTKDVLSFMRGSRCTTCYKEDKTYGYYPKRRNDEDTLYLLRFHYKNESFYKIGRSFNLSRRISTMCDHYTIKVCATFSSKHERVYMLEQCLHRLCKKEHITPMVPFKGSVNECFTPEILNHPEIISTFNL